MIGFIDELVPAEGYGFIRHEGERFFFHANALNATDFTELAQGSAVDFSAEPPDAGDEPGEHRRAVHVQLAAAEFPAVDNERLPDEKLNPRGRV
jgi:cold shock CspA family protein